VGTLDEELTLEAPYWRMVAIHGITEVDTWDWEEIEKANALIDMDQDFQTAFRSMSDHQSKTRAEAP